MIVNREDELALRSDRITRARKAAGYKSQEKFAAAMSRALGEDFSLKVFRAVEDGRRDLTIREAQVFARLTGTTLEFLTGESGTIDVTRAKGVWLTSAGAMSRQTQRVA